MPLYAHRKSHGEGCGYTVKLKATERTFEDNVEVREIDEITLSLWAYECIYNNSREDELAHFVPVEPFVNALKIGILNRLDTPPYKALIGDATDYVDRDWDNLFPGSLTVTVEGDVC